MFHCFVFFIYYSGRTAIFYLGQEKPVMIIKMHCAGHLLPSPTSCPRLRTERQTQKHGLNSKN